jgi:AraC family transcriptional regulator, positive regulator of tynA and feaB
MKTIFDTADVHPRHRADYWVSAVTDTFIPVTIADYERHAFSARYEAIDIGRVSTSCFRGTEQTFVRSPELIRDRDADFYVAVIHRSGSLSLDHHGHVHGPLRDSISLIDVTKPYRLKLAGKLDVLDVFIPRADLDRALGVTRQAVGLSLGPAQASTALIRNFFNGCMAAGDAFEPAVADRMATIGVELIAAGFAERLGHEPPATVAASSVVYRAKSAIDSRLGDPDLDTAVVAQMLRISPRRLQEVFRAENLSVDGWIWERRLTQAHRLLSDPACAALAVAMIAYRCGFTNQAHFSRRFRQRFGCSPSEFRSTRAETSSGSGS